MCKNDGLFERTIVKLCCLVFRRELLIGEKHMLKVRLAIEKESYIKICL